MNKICTSLEQSQKLLELGIDINTADMFYTIIDQGLYLEVKQGIEPSKDDIPCWSLAALLDILDYPQLSKDKLGGGKVGWMVSVYPNDCRYDSCWHDNPVDACIEMIIKLHELNLL